MAKISTYTPYQTTIKDTDVFILEDTVDDDTYGVLWSTIAALITSEPVGTIKAWDKTFPSTPALSASYIECDGAVISDAGSVYNTYRSRNLNGDDVVLTLTWASGVATVLSTDVTALAIGDDVTGSGIAASSYVSNIAGTTVTITDSSASGSISSTFTNDGDFIRGGSASGVGQKDALQGHRFNLDIGSGAGTDAIGATSIGYTLANIGSQDIIKTIVTDGVNGTPRTDSETRPPNRTMVYIMKIK